MRYIGQKSKLLSNIEELLIDKGVCNKNLSFCDAFSGTATVGAYFHDKYSNIISNDNLYVSYVLTQAKLNTHTQSTLFENLDCDPFVVFNNIDVENYAGDFIYNNYAPTASGRMFFSDENAKRIDYIRTTIEKWFLNNDITEQEKYYLIACLIESVSFVSNVAGVYGACLKTWDPRALKPMKFKKIECCDNQGFISEVHNEDILTFIK